MTQSTRTIADITAQIAVLDGIIGDLEHFAQRLRDAMAGPLPGYVVGWDYGMYATAEGISGGPGLGVGNCFGAMVYEDARVAEATARYTRNGHGLRAHVVTLAQAFASNLSEVENGLTTLWGQYADAEAELCAAEDVAADAAYWDAQADEAAYYDGVSLHWADRRDPDDCYEQRRDEKAERDADARQDR